MAFPAEEISAMISGYDQERRLGINVNRASGLIHHLASGYPCFASRMRLLVGEAMADTGQAADEAWSSVGLHAAAKAIAEETNGIFGSMDEKLSLYPDLKGEVQTMASNRRVSADPAYGPWKLGRMLGFLKNGNGRMALFNLIMEARHAGSYLSNPFSKPALSSFDIRVFINGGILDMDLAIEKLAECCANKFSE
jgi:hypothetical protein